MVQRNCVELLDGGKFEGSGEAISLLLHYAAQGCILVYGVDIEVD